MRVRGESGGSLRFKGVKGERLCSWVFLCVVFCMEEERKNEEGIERNSVWESGEGMSCVKISMYQIEIRMQSWPTTNLVNRILSPILSISSMF
ncbi:hypothetical protein COLO4_32173 [Corchorus olitorius]|uniref:Uncharacterized protein n=1 Tax=Corchorus olitorius TaxID=93759 RepID=A0A1R3H0T8_9ROSI|nr:hypothetical protein COLO4_32173 [Corchorus olitorius]